MAPDDIAATPAADTAPASQPAESSPAPSPAPSPEPSPAPAESQAPSTGEPGQKATLLDAVLKAVPAATERDVLDDGSTTPAPQGDQPDDSDQADNEAETDAPDDDDAPPPDVTAAGRRKWKKLLNQRHELRQEVETLRPSAEVGSELERFAQANDLSGDDIAGTLRIAAMIRAGDYASFYKAVAPFVRTAQEYLGLVLPKDLQQRVQAGHMTEPTAAEYARQRFDAMRSQQELQATTEAMSQQRVQVTQAEVQRAVTSFENKLSANDPDYRAKAPSVRRVVQALLHERGNRISTVDEAVQITDAAYKEVNKQFRALQPTPRPTRQLPNGASQTTSARAAPKTLMEAALQGLENARRAGG